jgi:hypothetical protein
MEDATILLWIDRGRTLSFALVAIGVVGEFLADRISSPIIKRHDAAQQAEIARLNKETAIARDSAAKAEFQATQAGEGTAKALANAAGANERAGKLELEAAAQRERAAKAERDLLELRRRMAPRHVTVAQETKLANDLRPLAGKHVVVSIVAGQPENEMFGNELVSAFKKAGLEVHPRTGMMLGGATQPGISIIMGKKRASDANLFTGALIDVDLATKQIPVQNSPVDDLLEISVAPR